MLEIIEKRTHFKNNIKNKSEKGKILLPFLNMLPQGLHKKGELSRGNSSAFPWLIEKKFEIN